MELLDAVKLSEKKRLKYDDIILGKHYYVKVDNEEEHMYLYILVINKGKLPMHGFDGINYHCEKILEDGENVWKDCKNSNDYDDDDNFLTKKEINSRNKEVMVFE